MRNILVLFFVFIASYAFSQRSTYDNYFGSWGNDASWDGTTAPAYLNLPDPDVEDYTINGYINVGTSSSVQDLTFDGSGENNTITINDTLVVYGDVDFANKSMTLDISSGGFLIIFGNLSMSNKVVIASDGNLIVSGTFNKSGSQGSFTGTGNVYASDYTGQHMDSFVVPSDQLDTDTDLQNDLPDIYDFVQEGGSTPLPVELLFFNAYTLDDQIELDWATASELNNDFFTLERSRNGRDFELLTTVEGNGTTTLESNYKHVDNNPYLGLSFYRLSQTDYDGTTEVFPMISVVYASDNNKFTISPNPIRNQNIKVKASSIGRNEQNQLNIIDLQGELIETIKLISDNYGNLDVDLQLKNQLKKGTYIIELLSETHKEYLKVVVTE